MTTLDPRALEEAARVKCRQDEELMLLPDWGDLDGDQQDALLGEAAEIITAYLDTAQPVVETVEGLIALGDGAVIRDRWGGLNEKRGTWWTGFGPELIRTADMANALPARVIWRPHD